MNDLKENFHTQASETLPRKTWLLKNCMPSLIVELKKNENLNFNEQQVFDIFSSADPSENNSAVQWISNIYLKGGFLYEDIIGGKTSKVYDTLVQFNKYKQNLPSEKRSLYHYKTLASLYTSIDQYCPDILSDEYDNNLNQRELKNHEKNNAHKETLFLIDQKYLTIVVPLTGQAAKWWGKGTRWCTSAQNNNMFEHYNKDAPLIIVLFKDNMGKNRRLQFWHSDETLQFMDETDAQVTKEFVQNNLNKLKYLSVWAAENYGIMLENVPENFKNYDFFKRMVTKFGLTLAYVPQDQLTYNLCSLACQADGIALKYVPDRFKDPSLCSLACKQNGWALQYILKENRTFDLCKQAVCSNSSAIKYVPEIFLTVDFYNQVVNLSPSFLYEPKIDLLSLGINKQVYKKALSKDGTILGIIPDTMLNNDLYQTALKQNGLALQYVPEKDKTTELCRLAIEQNGFALFDVPKNLGSLELCEQAIEKHPLSLCYVPLEFKTQKLCSRAFDLNVKCFHNIPTEFQTDQMREKFIDVFLSCQTTSWNPEQLLKSFQEIITRYPDDYDRDQDNNHNQEESSHQVDCVQTVEKKYE